MARSIDHLQDVLINKVQTIESIQSTETLISLQNPIQRTVMPQPLFCYNRGSFLIRVENRYKRFHRVKSVLDRRQTDLTVCLDEVHKHHNLSAIVPQMPLAVIIFMPGPQEQRR